MKNFAVVLSLLSVAAIGQAQTLVSNLHLQRQQSGWLCNSSTNTAMSFTAGSNMNLQSVTMYGYGMIRTSPLVLQIHADNQGQPGAVLFDLVGNDPISEWLDYTYTPVAVGTQNTGGQTKAQLGAGNTYWLVGSSTNASAIYGWGHTNAGGGEQGLPGWSIGDNPMVRHNNGAWQTTNWIPSQFSIQGQPVPEPSSILAIGLGGVALFRRRQRA